MIIDSSEAPVYHPVGTGLPAIARETLIKSFDKLRMNGNLLIPFVVSLSNHERNQINQRVPSVVSRASPLLRRTQLRHQG
jgi:hypothetical protein